MLDYIAAANTMTFTIIMLPMLIIHGHGGTTPC
jgi:hypothetical protein